MPCAIEVHYLAVLVQVIEVPAPVRPDSEDIHIVVADIIDFLAVVFLGYHLIGNAEGLHGLDAVHQRLLHINLAAVFVEVRGSDAHDQVVAQLLRPAQQVYVSVVQQVERAVGDDFLHSLILRLGGCGWAAGWGRADAGARRSSAVRPRMPNLGSVHFQKGVHELLHGGFRAGGHSQEVGEHAGLPRLH